MVDKGMYDEKMKATNTCSVYKASKDPPIHFLWDHEIPIFYSSDYGLPLGHHLSVCTLRLR